MIKQLGTATKFLTLVYAELRWKEPPCIINKLKKLRISNEELERKVIKKGVIS